MISIDIKQLKKFLSAAKNIKNRNILPICDYIKLECKGTVCTMTKTNLEAFVVCEVDAAFSKDETVLIDEHTLNSAVAYVNGNILNISVVGKKVFLKDGVGESWCSFEDPKIFPKIESNNDLKKTNLSTEIISALSIARNHTKQTSEMTEWKCFVQVAKVGKKVLIGASNDFVMYLKFFDEDMPEMILSPDVINAISDLPYADVSSSEKFDFFDSVGVTYGFRQSVSVKPELNYLWKKLEPKNSFSVCRKSLLKFCEKVIGMNKSSIVPEIYLKDEGEDLIMVFDGPIDSQGAQEVIKATNKTTSFPKTAFQPRFLITALKDLGTDTVSLTKHSGQILVTVDDDENYKGTIMELV
jgi:hypothetical protein